ncbi:15744_t:CDS:2 [Funneliformis mosseae]|uniref:15744_t:CDS:1 n=1 Tax=Funneliformis mosseae TaxID=27381 RepID=A0A9N9C4E3_FUNMO|nr:15744_t:CDS:2 [Funneliformis mosseae]
MPYEELLPRELKKDILRYHMLPGIESPDSPSSINTPEPPQSPTASLSSESSDPITSIITCSYFPPQPPQRKMAHIDSNLINHLHVALPKGSIRCFKGWGPIFGDLNGDSNDLAMTNLGNWSSSSGSYENVGIPNHFKVEEWEVFQIKKKKEYELLGI